MGVAETFREVLESHGSNKGDSAEIVDYIISMLEDEDFEFGPDGEEAYEAIGPFLVGSRLHRPHLYMRMGAGKQLGRGARALGTCAGTQFGNPRGGRPDGGLQQGCVVTHGRPHFLLVFPPSASASPP